MHARRRLTRGVSFAVLAGALVAVPAATSVASATSAGPKLSLTAGVACQMSPLPVPEGVRYSEVTGGDHSGRYLAGDGTAFDGTQPRQVSLLWIKGEVSELNTDPLAPYAEVHVTDINAHGIAIGNRVTDFSTFHTDAWMYSNGDFTLLPGLKPTDATNAVAINKRGEIVGTSEDDSVDPVVSHAVIWSADNPGSVRELTVDGQSPPWATGIDIDDNSTALGLLGQRTTPEARPFVWPARGSGYPLNAPAATGFPFGVAIHDEWVTGEVVTADGFGVVALWNLSSGNAQVISTELGAATAVNKDGTVATFNALIYRNGQVRMLDGYPTVLSDYGTAAGSDGLFGSGHAVMWTGC